MVDRVEERFPVPMKHRFLACANLSRGSLRSGKMQASGQIARKVELLFQGADVFDDRLGIFGTQVLDRLHTRLAVFLNAVLDALTPHHFVLSNALLWQVTGEDPHRGLRGLLRDAEFGAEGLDFGGEFAPAGVTGLEALGDLFHGVGGFAQQVGVGGAGFAG